MYSAKLLDHFEHPRNSGVLADADASMQVENPACGDVLRLAVKLENGAITQIRFQAKGCVPSIACASALTELVRDRTLAQAGSVTRTMVIEEVGGVPPASGHAAQLAVDCLGALIEAIRS